MGLSSTSRNQVFTSCRISLPFSSLRPLLINPDVPVHPTELISFGATEPIVARQPPAQHAESPFTHPSLFIKLQHPRAAQGSPDQDEAPVPAPWSCPSPLPRTWPLPKFPSRIRAPFHYTSWRQNTSLLPSTASSFGNPLPPLLLLLLLTTTPSLFQGTFQPPPQPCRTNLPNQSPKRSYWAGALPVHPPKKNWLTQPLEPTMQMARQHSRTMHFGSRSRSSGRWTGSSKNSLQAPTSNLEVGPQPHATPFSLGSSPFH